MKITVYNAKGGVGKTPIAVNIALAREYAMGTNEDFQVLDSVMPEERLIAISPNEPFPMIPDGIDIVFDLGGSISSGSESIKTAIAQSDVVVVPVNNEFKALAGAVNTIRELERLTDKIVVVATKLQKEKKEIFTDWTDSNDFRNVEAAVHSKCSQKHRVLPLKASRVFDNIFDREVSIDALAASDPLAAYNYRDVKTQFDVIFSVLDTYA